MLLQLCSVYIVFSGNFCPVCHKTYADDDWNCKMVQCSICENWVHANCEGMSGMWRKYVKCYQTVWCEPTRIERVAM